LRYALDSSVALKWFLLVARAYAISSAFRQGVYDCVYVALAEREGCEFVTADTKLIANLGAQFPFIVELASL
jgi:predicted nucleic acid-binding protein